MPPTENDPGEAPPAPPAADDDLTTRIDRLAGWSPLYATLLAKSRPELRGDLEAPDLAGRPPPAPLAAPDFRRLWEASRAPRDDRPAGPPAAADPDRLLRDLQRFRRRQSLRIAFREVNDLAAVADSLAELTALAEFCLETLLAAHHAAACARFGEPWDDDRDRPARFAILGLGKLGGGELNFCSDIDLIFLFDGRGSCRKGDRRMPVSSGEFFVRLARDLCGALHRRSADGFLYNVDLRLRPQGDAGPLVHSLEAMESYYYVSGQAWERLALIKARPVAGYRPLGEEFLEIVNPFRYPRHPPPFLLETIAGVKRRTEREVVGPGTLERHLKCGPGGIREIEFFIQALQLVNGGRIPFLQTPSTLAALGQLERYQVIDPDQAAMLRRAYLALRRLENAVQIREEKQTHTLPEDPALRERLAAIAGHPDVRTFDAWLDAIRQQVRANYRELFPATESEDEIQEWTLVLSGHPPAPSLADQITRWFGHIDADTVDSLRALVLGDAKAALTREHVLLFLSLAKAFDTVLPRLADPLATLGRVSRFGRAYGLPRQFLRTCAESPRLFSALCLLFDRSRFIHELLSANPSIIEEVLGPGHHHDKEVADHLREIDALPRDDLPRWLWLYVKAEQVRLAIRDLLGETDLRRTAAGLSTLADAAVQAALDATGAGSRLAVVALGKLGGRELTFGSDLDLLVLAEDATDEDLLDAFGRFRSILVHSRPLGPTFEIDLRLRPHGDAGPRLVSPSALDHYFSGGGARFWERMAFVRSRPVAGSPQLAEHFAAIRRARIFEAPVTRADLASIADMRRRIEKEKGAASPPEHAFKAGRGGLVDVEFLCQRFQLTHGRTHPALQTPNTGDALDTLESLDLVPTTALAEIRNHHAFLREVERAVRRDANRGTATLDHASIPRLARWLDFPDPDTFEIHLRTAMDRIRRLVHAAIDIPDYPD